MILEQVEDPLSNKIILPSLVFSTCLDAPLKQYLRSLVDKAGSGLDQIFSHCEGYPLSQDCTINSRLAYLRKHQVQTQTFYVNTIGRTVEQIHQEAELRHKIELFLDRYREETESYSADKIRQAIQDFVRQEPSLAWAMTTPAQASLGWQIREKLHLFGGLLLILVLGLLFLPLSPLFWIILRCQEEAAPHPRQDPNFRLSQFHRIHLAQDEDFVSQNQFSVVGFIKPGWFRYLTLRVILGLANFITHHFFRNGDLGTWSRYNSLCPLDRNRSGTTSLVYEQL